MNKSDIWTQVQGYAGDTLLTCFWLLSNISFIVLGFPAGWIQRLPHLKGEAGHPGSFPALRSGVSAGPRLGGHRSRHQLHQQLQPVCHADCR